MYLHVSVSAHGAEETGDLEPLELPDTGPGRTASALLNCTASASALSTLFFPLRFIFILCA